MLRDRLIWRTTETSERVLCVTDRRSGPFEEAALSVREFHLPSATLYITNEGLRNADVIRDVLRTYRKAKKMGIDSGTDLGGAWEGHVWDIGSSVVVKEAQQIFHASGSLMNMELMRQLTQVYGPDYVKFPTHYASLVMYSNLERTRQRKIYNIMQKAPGIPFDSLQQEHLPEGITIQDLRDALLSAEGKIKSNINRYVIKQATDYFSPDNMTTDNVLVDVVTPNKSMPVTLWVVDQ